MSDLVRFPEGSTIGIHAMAFLAAHDERLVTQSEIAEVFDVSEAHLAKVMQRLRHAGLVDSTRGPAGGFVLAKKASDISLLEIHEALQGPQKAMECLLGLGMCEPANCPMGTAINRVDSELLAFLKNTKLKSMALFLERNNEVHKVGQSWRRKSKA